MALQPPPVYQFLDRLLAREVPVREFERWVYGSPELEAELGPGDHLRLLEFDYGQPDAAHELYRVVASIYEHRRPGMLVPDRVWRLACGLAAGTLDPVTSTHRLAELWYAGHEWIPLDFVGISSELDELPRPEQRQLWDPAALASKLREWEPTLDQLAGDAAGAVRRLLRERYPDAPCPSQRDRAP
ncbi:MAG: hypothetical protein AB1941_16515 [Gemmatimonadota bacterium]